MKNEIFTQKDFYDINDLLEIMKILRGENGCVWDKEQNHKSIRMNLLEEAYEVMEAIDEGGSELLREELGDLLLQVVFHTEIEREKKTFDFDGVCDGICKKLIYRHPHVFSSLSVKNSDEVLKNWDSLKSSSKGEQTVSERLESVSRILPSLMRGDKVSKRVINTGLSGINKEAFLKNLENSISELRRLSESFDENESDDIEEKIGEVLFSCCNLSAILKKDSEKSLTTVINRFIIQFKELEEDMLSKGLSLDDASNEAVLKLFSGERR